jgi:hypothetical protein
LVPAVGFGVGLICRRFPKRFDFGDQLEFGAVAALVALILGGVVVGTFHDGNITGVARQIVLINPHTLLVSRSGAVVYRVFKHEEAISRDSYETILNNGLRLVSYNTHPAMTEMNVVPITSNPKVRSILYETRFTYGGTLAEMASLLSFTATASEKYGFETKSEDEIVKKYLAMLLYDFQDQHSKEMAEFTNPLRQEQQKRFEELVMNYLRPRLDGAPIRLTSVRFRFPDTK